MCTVRTCKSDAPVCCNSRRLNSPYHVIALTVIPLTDLWRLQVDILLPRYKEDWELYSGVVMAALAVDYPAGKVLVHVCDDGNRLKGEDAIEERVRKLMARFPQLRYHSRPDGSHAKAGNLNSALANCTGAILTVLDADHCCKREFLLRTVPHLLALDAAGSRTATLCPRTAFVQTT